LHELDPVVVQRVEDLIGIERQKSSNFEEMINAWKTAFMTQDCSGEFDMAVSYRNHWELGNFKMNQNIFFYSQDANYLFLRK
jgi:hypothetical protein